MACARQVALALAASVLAGCDIVQGFQHAGDALFPPVDTYLDVPGYRMVSGHYRYLDMLTTSEPFILARSTTDGDDTLFAMHYDSPVPCAIPNAASYWSDAATDATRTYVAFFDATGSGPLRFSDLDCTPFDFTLENANLPVAYSPTGLVIQVGADLFDVNPSTQGMRLLASSVTGIDAQRHIVLADGQLDVFDAKWSLVRAVGDGVVAFYSVYGATFFEDNAGVSRLTITQTGDALSLSTLNLASDACHLTILPQTPNLELVSFYSPCADKQLFVWDTQSHQGTPLALAVDPSELKLYASLHDSHPDLATDPYYALYLTDVDASSGTGSLALRLPDATVLPLGDGAALERADLSSDVPNGDIDRGYALLDVDGETGRFVRFDLAGNVSDISLNVIRRPAESAWSRLVVAVDSELGNLVEVVDGQAVTVATNVPRTRYAYLNRYQSNPLEGKMAWFSGLSGDVGTLSLAAPNPKSGVLDDQGHEALYAATAVASDVYESGHGFMFDLPGFVYFTNWDAVTSTGRLEYSNTELGFSATVSDGVSDYLQPGTGLLYSVPFGAAAGIWLARGK
jgi:hypothetical protein